MLIKSNYIVIENAKKQQFQREMRIIINKMEFN